MWPAWFSLAAATIQQEQSNASKIVGLYPRPEGRGFTPTPVKERTEQLEKIDERWTSRFEPAGIAANLRSHGFCDIEDINFQEITSRFGHAVQGLAPGQAGLHVVHAKH